MVDLNSAEKQKLEEIRRAHGLKFIILHGSYAQGKEHEESDLDIAVVGEQAIPFKELFAIQGELEDLLGHAGVEMDIKSLNRADPLFRYLVVHDSVLLAGDPHEFNELKAYAFRDYMDSRDLRTLERRMIEQKQRLLSERYASGTP